MTTTITLKASQKKIEEVKKYMASIGVKYEEDLEDDWDTRTEAEIAENIVQSVKAIKEGRAKTYTKEEFWDIVNN